MASKNGTEETRTPAAGWRDIVKFDVPASIVVFLVAVPLSLGIALASGAPVYSGLISSVVGGILGGILGGSAMLVSGAAAGMVVVAAGLITQFGWVGMCAITVCAGLLQILFGVSRLARVALGISPAIVHGMLAGIGVTIVLGQLHVILGFAAQSSPLENVRALPADIVADHPWATGVGVLTFAILLVWPKLPATVRKVPGPLAAIVLVTVLATVADLPVERVDIPGNLLAQLSFVPRLPEASFGAFAFGVITVALIASVENLLSAVSVDKLHKGPRSNLSRELIGQGITNMACGSIGGLPVTGVIVRSSTNVMAGARTRWSTILHGVWVLVFTVLLGGLIQQIPMASLAGLLVYVGIKLVNMAHIRTAARHGDMAIYAATLGGVVVLDLMKGVFLGLVVAVILMVRRTMWSGIQADEKGDGWHVVLKGTLSFLSTPRLSLVLNKIPAGKVVHLDLIADYLDHSAVETITDWQTSYEDAGGTVVVHEIGHPWLRTAQTGQPTIHRKVAAISTPRWMASSSDEQSPESERLATDKHGDTTVNPALHRGVETYRRHTAASLQPMLSELAGSQSPKTMLITCADSRIVPSLITSSGPGELFVVRNIGNLVPPHEPTSPAADTSVAAAVEYAVGVLEVEDIVVCGHSSCGAMTAMLDGTPNGYPSLQTWLHGARPSLQRFRSDEPIPLLTPESGDASTDPVDELSKHNVMQQVDHLRAYHCVTAAEREGRLRVSGMFLDLASAGMFSLEEREHEPGEAANLGVVRRIQADAPG